MALSSRSRLLELLVIVHDGSVEGLGAFGGCVVRHVAAARLVLLLFITLLRVLATPEAPTTHASKLLFGGYAYNTERK